ncbi:MAG: LysM peptidoglycan-binding domain-containing protein [Anaerolineales bacterium]
MKNSLLAALLLLIACACVTTPDPASVRYDPFRPLDTVAATLPASPTPRLTPTRVPLSLNLPPTPPPGLLLPSPTPDAPHALPTPRAREETYVVQPGDTLNQIAVRYGVSIESLVRANALSNPDFLEPGQILLLPTPDFQLPAPEFKIIPDSELVYGPASALFDVEAFVKQKGGYLATYQEEMDGQVWSGAQIVLRVAQNQSVNPRLLLALIEHRSAWVTRASPSILTPLDLPQPKGLYRQLSWAANELNRGYYLWRVNGIGSLFLMDGTIIPLSPRLNAGTVAIQRLFSLLDDRPAWEQDVSPFGFFQTYFILFGNPFQYAFEPLLPSDLRQPPLLLPFEPGVSWAFTGGPHPAWDSGSAWAALDFAPPDTAGCQPSAEWVTAVADGWIVRSANGVVIQDLDGDGYEQTGWSILYLHIATQERVAAGTYLFAGERIGHPSCEGGVASATHLHLARRYNGEWIPADGPLPFNLEGWVSAGWGRAYDGLLRRGDQVLQAEEGFSELNTLRR